MQKYSDDLKLDNINLGKSVFWSLGNSPTQKSRNLENNFILNNLKILYLLSDEKVIAAASFYFESNATQSVTKQLKKLFEDGEILYFIEDDLENAIEHGEMKISKASGGTYAHKNKSIINKNGSELDSLGPLLRRPPRSISNTMAEIWEEEVYSTSNNTLGFLLRKRFQSDDQLGIIQKKLIYFVRSRNKSFVWEYIKPFLIEIDLHDKHFLNMVRKKLPQIYALSTARVLGLELDESLKSGEITINSKYDSYLFMQILNQLNVLSTIINLSVSDLQILKKSPELAIFKIFFFSLIKNFSYKNREILSNFDYFKKFENSYTCSNDREQFVKNFKIFCKKNKLPKTKYKKPLSYIKDNFDTIGYKTIEGMININDLFYNKESEKMSELLSNKSINNKIDVFICHNSIDKQYIRIISEELKQNNVTTWLDEEQLTPGRPWQIELEEQISIISSAAVFIGKSGIGPWQENEIRGFLSEFVDRGCLVIPVILPNTITVPDLPIFLKQMTWVDLRYDYQSGIKKLCKAIKYSASG